MKIDLRKATKQDARFIFNVRNQYSVRKQSWNTITLVWEKHKKWFNENFTNYWIIGKNLGFIRLNNGHISIALLDKHQGKGIGTKVLKKKIFEKSITAEIKLDNLQSLFCFLKAGYKPIGLILKKVKQ
jgi:RimJ/RimL family protein N-acetyltransferase